MEPSPIVIYFHHDCPDGRFSAALLSTHLSNGGAEVLIVRSASASMARFEMPPQGTGTVYFVDLCPTEAMVDKIERCARHIVVLDHHMSSEALCKSLCGRPGWTIHYHNDMCGAQIVDKYYPRARTTPQMDAALKAISSYDLWLDPVDEVFCFKFGTDVLWNRVVDSDETATAVQCNRFWDALNTTSYEDVVALGAPAMALVKAEYAECVPFYLQFASTDEWNGRAIAIRLKRTSNPSILGHWLLASHPEEVMVGVWPDRGGSYAASLRSRTLCIPSTLPWAKGHSCACGGMLPDTILSQLAPAAAGGEK